MERGRHSWYALSVHVGLVLHLHHFDHVQIGRRARFLDCKHCIDNVLNKREDDQLTNRNAVVMRKDGSHFGEEIGELLVDFCAQRSASDVDEDLTRHFLLHFQLLQHLNTRNSSLYSVHSASQ